MSNLIVRGGTVVDGTGAPGRAADVRVRDGVIVEVAPHLVPDGEREVDAHGALVTPGLIDSHTHYDIEMFWDPSLDPLPVYGITTIVMGNCGLGIAPVSPEVRDDIVDLLCFIEELPPILSDTSVPWGWSSWSEYADRTREQATAVQPFAYTAHNALRASAMGREAWERAATTDEVTAMAVLLDDALDAGALGLSSNWFDTDRQRRLVPSRLSDAHELDALLDVVARHRRATFQVIARKRQDRRDALERSCGRGIRSLSLGDGVGGGKVEEGLTTWYLGGGNEPFTPMLGFQTSIATAAIPPWHEMVNGPAEAKLATLMDPEWRARARAAWDDPLPEQNAFRRDTLDQVILTDSENGTGPTGISLASLAAERDQHASDALADWVLAQRHRLALPQAEQHRSADDRRRPARAGGARRRQPPRADGRHRRGRAPHHVLRRGIEPSPHHPLGARRRRTVPGAGGPLPHTALGRLLRAHRPGHRGAWAARRPGGLRTRRARDARPRTTLRPPRGRLPAHAAVRGVPRRGRRRGAHRLGGRDDRRPSDPARFARRHRGVVIPRSTSSGAGRRAVPRDQPGRG
jgi:N-acyl-D-amino-acid deacylase